MEQSVISNIRDFLNQKRFAMVGVSRDKKHFSRSLYREFLKNGYTLEPVNRDTDAIEGQRCFRHIADVTPVVSYAIILAPGDQVEQTVHESYAAGIQNLWLYGIAGTHKNNKNILEYCEQNNINVIPGYCPFMFLEDTSKFHHIHGFFLKLTGKYPR